MESAQILKISPNTIRRALKEALPYKGYFFSYTLLEPEFLHNIGFSYLTKLSVNCKSLITWGDPIFLTSSSVTPEFSQKKKSIFLHEIHPYVQGIIVELILSDASLKLTHTNARMGFKQDLINFPYFWFVFTFLSRFCSSNPCLTFSSKNYKMHIGIDFHTRNLPCFTDYYNIFYVNGVKVVSEDIFNLFTPMALAHFIMGDRTKQGNRLVLCTDSFTLQDTVRLMNVLIIRYRLECTLWVFRPNQFRICIRTKSMPLLRSIVSPHMHFLMFYKLGL